MLMVTMDMKSQSTQAIFIAYRCYSDGNYQ